MVRQLGQSEDLVDAEPEPPVDDPDRDRALAFRREDVLEAGLGQVWDRRAELAIALDRDAVVGRRLAAGHEQLGALVDDREADVAVVQLHLARARVADVLDLVVDREPALTEARLDPPAEEEVLPEDGRLEDLALGPQDALVAVPALAVADEPGGQPADPAVEPIRDLLEDMRLMELLGVVLAGAERVVETAGHDHPAAPGAEPAPVRVLVEPRSDGARVGDPRQRAAAELAASDVEGAVDDDVEGESRAGPELEQPDATAEAVPEGHQADPGDLVEPAHPAHQLGTGIGRAPQRCHDGASRFGSAGTAARPPPRTCRSRTAADPFLETRASGGEPHHSPLSASISSGVAGRSAAPSAAAFIQSSWPDELRYATSTRPTMNQKPTKSTA